MSNQVEPEIFNKLRRSVDAAFTMVAGIQLDVFTQLKNGPMTAEQIAKLSRREPDDCGSSCTA